MFEEPIFLSRDFNKTMHSGGACQIPLQTCYLSENIWLKANSSANPFSIWLMVFYRVFG
jgi:hypothetical protein